MISVVICSINDALLKRISLNLEQTIGIEYELIDINNTQNQYSIAQAYNLGAKKSKYPYLCFVHEDVCFHTKNWGYLLINHLKNKDVSLVGVLGNVIKTLAPSGVFTFDVKTIRINHLQRTLNNTTEHYCVNPYFEHESEVKVLDGLFLAISKTNFLKYPFDEKLITGFHGYDVDFSLGQLKNGKVIVIYDVLLEHFSFGNFNKEWIDVQLNVTNKWRAELPVYDSNNAHYLKDIECKNMIRFLFLLFKYNYPKKTQLFYLSRIISLSPLNPLNFYLLRKVLIYGKSEKLLKRLIN
jgi:hypothetical protein